MKKLAVLAVAGLMSVTTSAKDWALISQTSKADFYIDLDSIDFSGRYPQAFIKYAYNQVRMPAADGIKFNEAVVLHQFDCKSRPMRLKSLSVLYKLNGVVAYHVSSPDDWIIYYPGTASEDITKFICSY